MATSKSLKPTKVTILCTDERHPIRPYIDQWALTRQGEVDLKVVQRVSELSGGDLLFLLSCHEFVQRSLRDQFTHSLVVHASELPLGRGWSPHIWQILEGKTEIKMTLLEAADRIDSGVLWQQTNIDIPPHAIWSEINDAMFDAVFNLMDFAIRHRKSTVTMMQRSDIKPTYYPRRRPEDSKLDPNKSLAEQFDLLRVADPERYPAYFEFREHTYVIRLEKR